MKNQNRLDAAETRARIYKIVSFTLVILIALTFLFPLYWIITGSFKTRAETLATTPVWLPSEWILDNYQNLMSKRAAPLFDFTIPGLKITAFGYVFKIW